MDYEPEDDDDLIFYVDEPKPFWTRRRIFLTIFAIIILITFLAYTLHGLFLPPPPPPPIRPGTLI